MAETISSFDKFLEQMRRQAPAPIDPQELERNRREDRFFEASRIRDRAPRWIGKKSMRELEECVPVPSLLNVSKKWSWGCGNVIFLGPTKKGKTAAQGYLFRRLILESVRTGENWDSVVSMRWLRAQKLQKEAEAHPMGKGELPEIKEAVSCRLLFIDELGWEKDRSMFSNILAERYDAELPTIISSGYRVEELEEIYGEAFIRRMAEHEGRKPYLVECF